MCTIIKNVNKNIWIICICFVIQVVCFSLGLYKSVHITTLEVIPKVHMYLTRNFLLCLAISSFVLFIEFWLNYWTYGFIGTVLCAGLVFKIGTFVKASFVLNSWQAFIFLCLELILVISAVLLGVYYKFENNKNCKTITLSCLLVIFILFLGALLEIFIRSGLSLDKILENIYKNTGTIISHRY